MHETDSPYLALPTAARLPNIGLLIELGRQRRKQIKRLKQGSGALTRQIQAAVNHARDELGIAEDADIVPVVLLYRHGTSEYTVVLARG